MLLAASMASGRDGSLLDAPVSLDGWGISFRPPAGWSVQPMRTRVIMEGTTSHGEPLLINMRRITTLQSDITAPQLVKQMMKEPTLNHPAFAFDLENPEPRPMGDREGAEIIIGDGTIAARAVVPNPGEGIVVTLIKYGRSPSAYDMYDQVCRSISWEPAP